MTEKSGLYFRASLNTHTDHEKTIKGLLLGTLPFAIAITIIIGCSKKDSPQIESGARRTTSPSTQMRVDNALAIDPRNIVMTASPADINLPDFDSMFACGSTLWNMIMSLSPEAQQILFTDYPWLKGYFIKIQTQYQGWDMEVYIVKNTDEGARMALLQKHNGSFVDGKYSGEDVLQDMSTGLEILHNTYVDGVRTVEVENFTTWGDQTPPQCQVESQDKPYFRRCTYGQFNAIYQKAKADCEGDFMCDLGFSFNPCRILYIAVAMHSCW